MRRSSINKTNTDKRMCVSCPCCGHVICRAVDARDVETICPRCGGRFQYSASDTQIVATIIRPPKSWRNAAV